MPDIPSSTLEPGALRRIIQHLRFPFSFFLLPVYLLAVGHATNYFLLDALVLFVILHIVVYPSSNGFNSLMDRDEGSIGGIEHPASVPPSMRWVTLLMDALSVSAMVAWFSAVDGLLLLVYVLVSRMYSQRGIRLKRFPIIGYLSVVLFQGAWVFGLCVHALTGGLEATSTMVVGALMASLLIGASYPLTQIYQHAQDRMDGVVTLSAKLGIRGTMVFAAVMYALFMMTIAVYGWLQWQSILPVLMALLITSPAAVLLWGWARKVWVDEGAADFKHAMRMSKWGAVCMNVYFFTLLWMEEINDLKDLFP